MNQKFRFHSKEFTIECCGRTLHFWQPQNAVEIIDELTESQAHLDKYQPYWVEHWPSAETFSGFIANETFSTPKRILEIGCGLGVLTAAFVMKGNNVTALDISEDACRYCNSNTRLNSIRASVVCCDMRNIPFKNKDFDIIAASDILYEERMQDMLLDTLELLLNNRNRAWIADPCRRGWPQFKEKAACRGLKSSPLCRADLINGMKIEIIELRV